MVTPAVVGALREGSKGGSERVSLSSVLGWDGHVSESVLVCASMIVENLCVSYTSIDIIVSGRS